MRTHSISKYTQDLKESQWFTPELLHIKHDFKIQIWGQTILSNPNNTPRLTLRVLSVLMSNIPSSDIHLTQFPQSSAPGTHATLSLTQPITLPKNNTPYIYTAIHPTGQQPLLPSDTHPNPHYKKKRKTLPLERHAASTAAVPGRLWPLPRPGD